MSNRSESPDPITELELEIVSLQEELDKLDSEHPRGKGHSPDPIWDKEMRRPIIQKINYLINQIENELILN